MKTSIYVRNTEDKLFEIFNTNDGILCLGKEKNHNLIGCKEQDLIYYAPKTRPLPNTNIYWEVVHKSKSVEESITIKNFILQKLKEKSDLMMQRQAVKKINSDSVSLVIDNINREIRTDYFEIHIKDILGSQL